MNKSGAINPYCCHRRTQVGTMRFCDIYSRREGEAVVRCRGRVEAGNDTVWTVKREDVPLTANNEASVTHFPCGISCKQTRSAPCDSGWREAMATLSGNGIRNERMRTKGSRFRDTWGEGCRHRDSGWATAPGSGSECVFWEQIGANE